MKKVLLLISIIVLLALVSCSTTGLKTSPYKVGSDLAQTFLSTDVLNSFHSKTGRNPVVVIGLVASSNADDSQISSGFKNKLVASGKVDLIIGSSERDSIREERIEQLNWGNMEQAKSLANEMVADYFGRLFITPYGSGYLISADIVEVETGKVVWSDQYEQVVKLPEKNLSVTSAPSTDNREEKKADSSSATESKQAHADPVNTPAVQETEEVVLVNEKDKLGRYVMANLPNNVTLLKTASGNMAFQFKLKNTDFDYRQKGYDSSEWPSYTNTFEINLNDPAWSDFKGKRISILQGIRYYNPDGGSSTSGYLRVEPDGRGVYNGLYDLSGKNSFRLITEVKTPVIDARDLRYEFNILLPVELKDGSSARRVTELPSAILFDADFSPEKAYIISIRDVPETPYSNGFFSNILTSLLGGEKHYVESRNGDQVESTGYVMNITKHGTKFDADLFITGIEEDFMIIINDLNYDTFLFNDYGTISFKETSDTTWPEDNCINLSSFKSGETTVTSDKEWTIIWSLPSDDNNSYRLSFSTEAVGLSNKWGAFGSSGGAGRPFNDSFIISRTENTKGFVTIYSQPEREKLTWTIEKID